MKSISSIGKNPNIQALCIGKFDGLHLGHQAIFSTLYSLVEERSQACVLVICKNRQSPSLTPFQESFIFLPLIYLELCSVAFMSGKEFVTLLKESYPSLKKIVVGEDFRFGKDRSCGIDELREGFEVIVVPEVKLEGEGVHTQAILSYLQKGDMPKVGAMLGRAYSIKGRVQRGQGLGSKELYPTINLGAPLYILPQSGVYFSATLVKNKIYTSVSFLGHRVSTDGAFCIESHLLDFSAKVQEGEEVEIIFFQKLRENQKFDSLPLLKEQISKDIAQAKEYHSAKDTIALATSKLL